MFTRKLTPALSRPNFVRLFLVGALALALAAPAFAQDKPAAPAAAPAAATPAAAAPAAAAAAPAEAAPAAGEKKAPAKKKKRVRKATGGGDGRSSATGLAKVSGSLEQRHQVCLAFVRRHNLDCDPWQTPTCGADTGYFRPPECVRPRSQQ